MDNISSATSPSDPLNAASAGSNCEQGSLLASPAESLSATDLLKNGKPLAELSKCGTANKSDALDHPKKEEMENVLSGAPPSGQTDAASAQGNYELEATKSYRHDVSTSVSQHSDETPSTTSSSGASNAVPEGQPATADNKEIVPEPEDQSGLSDDTNATFEELIAALRQMGAETKDGEIKVDADYLTGVLGEDEAKRLIAAFNKESTSMDLVITKGVWDLNRDPAAMNGRRHKRVPEWCVDSLRKLVAALSDTYNKVLVEWKEGCEDARGILRETLNGMDARTQKANEIHTAALKDMKEDLHRAKIEHEKMLQEWRLKEDKPSATVHEENCEGELNSPEDTQKTPSNTQPGILSVIQRAWRSFNEQIRNELPGNDYPMEVIQKPASSTTYREVTKKNAAVHTAPFVDVKPHIAQYEQGVHRSHHGSDTGEMENPQHAWHGAASPSLRHMSSNATEKSPVPNVSVTQTDSSAKEIHDVNSRQSSHMPEFNSSQFLMQIILPLMESTSENMRQYLKMEVLNIAIKYSQGEYPTELVVSDLKPWKEQRR